jgi:hypothetical protein
VKQLSDVTLTPNQVEALDELRRRLFSEFAVTIGSAVLVSGAISLTLTPMLCAKVLRVPKEHGAVFTKDRPVVWRCRNCGYLHEAEEAPKESIYDKKFYELAKYIDVEKKDMGKKGVKLDTVLKDPRFHEIYEQKRDERLRALLKGAVPVPNTQLSQVLNAGTGTQRMGVSDYHPLIQRELLGAYLDAIRTYKQTTAMA